MRGQLVRILRGVTATLGLLGGASAGAEEVVHDFRGARFDRQLLRFDGPDAPEFYTPEAEGLRVRIGYGRVPTKTAGVAWNCTIRGDFTATVHYEVLENERPKSGYGTGLELYAYLDSPVKKPGQSRDGLPLVRLARPAEGLVFRFSHMTYDDNDQRVATAVAEVPADPEKKRGRLRLSRQGATVIASFAEGDDGAFQELQRTDVGEFNIRMVRVAGAGRARLDARILEMRLEGPDLGLPAGIQATAGPTAPGQRMLWLLWGIGGAVVIFLAAIAVAWRKRSRTAAAPSAPEAHGNGPMVGFACSACGKNLKVKEDVAGKRVKCPGCGQLVQAPALELGEPGA
ncbi:MAG: DUF1583 domain-containing protein [Gemmataceae bacterium]|nr:DUF1583 domain-containing protein [Gemmataceae bacterium]